MEEIIYRKVKNKEEIDILYKKSSTYKDFKYEYDIETINFLKNNFDGKNNLYLITESNNIFAGFVSIDDEWWEKNSFFIREIFIEPNFQKNKIGETLMKKCLNHAIENNAESVVTQTAFENIPMQRLCEKLGFKKRENPQWKKGITYKLDLNQYE